MIEENRYALSLRGEEAKLNVIRGFIARRLLGFDPYEPPSGSMNYAHQFLYYQYIPSPTDEISGQSMEDFIADMADAIYSQIDEYLEENDIAADSISSADIQTSDALVFYFDGIVDAMTRNVAPLYGESRETLNAALARTTRFSDYRTRTDFLDALDSAVGAGLSMSGAIERFLAGTSYQVSRFLRDIIQLENENEDLIGHTTTYYKEGSDESRLLEEGLEALLFKRDKEIRQDANDELWGTLKKQAYVKDRDWLFSENIRFWVWGHDIDIDTSYINVKLDALKSGTVTIGALLKDARGDDFNRLLLSRIADKARVNLSNPVAIKFYLITGFYTPIRTDLIKHDLKRTDEEFNRRQSITQLPMCFISMRAYNISDRSVEQLSIETIKNTNYIQGKIIRELSSGRGIKGNFSLKASLFSDIVLMPKCFNDSAAKVARAPQKLQYSAGASGSVKATMIIPKATSVDSRGYASELIRTLESYLNVDPNAECPVQVFELDTTSVLVRGVETLDFRPVAYKLSPSEKAYSYFHSLSASCVEAPERSPETVVGYTHRLSLSNQRRIAPIHSLLYPFVIDSKDTTPTDIPSDLVDRFDRTSVIHNIVGGYYGVAESQLAVNTISKSPAYTISTSDPNISPRYRLEIEMKEGNFLNIIGAESKKRKTLTTHYDDKRFTTTIALVNKREVDKFKILFTYLGYSVNIIDPTSREVPDFEDDDSFCDITLKQAKGQNLIATYYKAYYFNLVSGRYEEHTHKETDILKVNPILSVIDAFNMSGKEYTETEEVLRDFVLRDLPRLAIDYNLIIPPPERSYRALNDARSLVAYMPVLEVMDYYTDLLTKPMAMLFAALNVIEYNKKRANPFVREGDFVGSVIVKGSNKVSDFIAALDAANLANADALQSILLASEGSSTNTLLINIEESILQKAVAQLSKQGKEISDVLRAFARVGYNRLTEDRAGGARLKEGLAPKGIREFGPALKARLVAAQEIALAEIKYAKSILGRYSWNKKYYLFSENEYDMGIYDVSAQTSMYAMFKVLSKRAIPILSNWNSDYFSLDFVSRVKGFVGKKKDSALVDLSPVFETFYCADALRKVWSNRNKSIKTLSGHRVPTNQFATDKKGMPYKAIELILSATDGVAKDAKSVHPFQYVQILEILAETYEQVFEAIPDYGNVVAVGYNAVLFALTKDDGREKIKKAMQMMSAKGGSICIGQEQYSSYREETIAGKTETYALNFESGGLGGVITIRLPDGNKPYPRVYEAKGYNNYQVGSTYYGVYTSRASAGNLIDTLGLQGIADVANALLIAIYFASNGHENHDIPLSDVSDYYYRRVVLYDHDLLSDFGEAKKLMEVAILLSGSSDTNFLVLSDTLIDVMSSEIRAETVREFNEYIENKDVYGEPIDTMVPSSKLPED